MGSEFHPIRRLAMGGMAEVFLAMQLGIEGFEKLVVLKQILPHLRQDDDFVGMFLEEARLAASLRHQNVVETLDIHRDEENLFIAMEYISGEDLRFILAKLAKARQRMPVPIACRILADVAAGLEYAHTATDVTGQPRGIVHRDVGPSNILVDYQGVSRLADFGIAKADAANVYTKPGVLKGKFGYMAPEHVRQQKLDHRADVFALGVVMHEVLTGRRLFKEPTLAAVVQALVERKPASPSSINPEVPPSLDAVVVAALIKDRDARTQTACEVREQLERVLTEVGSATHQDVAKWMQTTFAERARSRQMLEREVVLEGRQIARAGDVDANALASLPLASASASGFESSFRSGSGDYPAVGESGSHRGMTGPHTSVAAATYQQAAASMGLRAQGDGTGTGSQSFGGTGTGSQSFGGGTGSQAGPPPQRSTLILLGAVLALLVIVGVMAGFLLGRSNNTVATTGRGSNKAGSSATAIQKQTATLIVHVHPKGARLSVAGKVVDDVGPSGTMVPIPAGARVRLSIGKEGYAEHVEVVELKAETTEHVHVNLRKAPTAVAAAGVVNNTTQDGQASTTGTTGTTGTTTDTSPTAVKKQAPRPVVRSSTRRLARKPTYNWRKAKKAGKKAAPKAPTTGAVVVTYTPAEATASLDGRIIARRSPARIDDVTAGTHRLTLTASGFKPALHTLTVVAGNEHRLSFELQKKPEPALVDFVSSPTGASVTVDGVRRGKTPLLGLRLSAHRAHSVKVKLAGHEVWSSRLTPTDGRNPPIVATLRPLGGTPAVATAATPPSVAPATAAPAITAPTIAALTIPRASTGDAARGRALYGSRCNSCHGKSAERLSTKRYTRTQWSRYFANGRHQVRAPLAKHLSRAQLKHIKAYLMSHAADVESATAAGVR